MNISESDNYINYHFDNMQNYMIQNAMEEIKVKLIENPNKLLSFDFIYTVSVYSPDYKDKISITYDANFMLNRIIININQPEIASKLGIFRFNHIISDSYTGKVVEQFLNKSTIDNLKNLLKNTSNLNTFELYTNIDNVEDIMVPEMIPTTTNNIIFPSSLNKIILLTKGELNINLLKEILKCKHKIPNVEVNYKVVDDSLCDNNIILLPVSSIQKTDYNITLSIRIPVNQSEKLLKNLVYRINEKNFQNNVKLDIIEYNNGNIIKEHNSVPLDDIDTYSNNIVVKITTLDSIVKDIDIQNLSNDMFIDVPTKDTKLKLWMLILIIVCPILAILILIIYYFS
jgi:hypothetical protein